jgi:hypothetical protein
MKSCGCRAVAMPQRREVSYDDPITSLRLAFVRM